MTVTSYSYDRNGNLLTLHRKDSLGNTLHDFDYVYYDQSNKLKNVAGNTTENYKYDAIGNLIYDQSEDIDTIEWTVYGKVARVVKANGSEVSYVYDASGNRITKTFENDIATIITRYIRDASGNVMAIYDDTTVIERSIYGSSRLGMIKGLANRGELRLGLKVYELSNHLGNVLTTISDRKIGVDAGADGVIDHFEAEVVSATDYYPFGLAMEGRTFSSEGYRWGFNGMERDGQIAGDHYDFGARVYNSRIGRFISVDPKWKHHFWNSPYSYAANSPIILIDKDGEIPLLPWLIWAGKNAAIGYTTDVMVQMSINYLLSEKETPEEALIDAWDNVNHWDASFNGLTNVTGFGPRTRHILNGASGVISNYMTRKGPYTAQDALQDFAIGSGASFLGGAITRLLNKKGALGMYKFLKKKGFQARTIGKILQLTGFGRSPWDFDKLGGGGKDMRGNLIEDWLGQTRYTVFKGWKQTSNNFKTYDFLNKSTGHGVDVKSVRNLTSSRVSKFKKRIDNLADDIASGNIKKGTLDIRYLNADSKAIKSLRDYAKEQGVGLTVKKFRSF